MIGNPAPQRKRGSPGSISEPAQTSRSPVIMTVHVDPWPLRHAERGIGV